MMNENSLALKPGKGVKSYTNLVAFKKSCVQFPSLLPHCEVKTKNSSCTVGSTTSRKMFQ